MKKGTGVQTSKCQRWRADRPKTECQINKCVESWRAAAVVQWQVTINVRMTDYEMLLFQTGTKFWLKNPVLLHLCSLSTLLIPGHCLGFPLPLSILQPVNTIQHTNSTMRPYKTPIPAWAVIQCVNSATVGTGCKLALFNEENRHPGNAVWPCIGPHSGRLAWTVAPAGWFSDYMSHEAEVVGCE